LRRVVTVLLTIAVILAGGVVWVLGQALSDRATVPAADALSPADLEQGQRIVRQLSPAHLRDGERRVLRLRARDLELGLNYLLATRGRVRVTLPESEIGLQVSLHLPAPLAGRNLDLGLTFGTQPKPFALKRFTLGRLPLPVSLVRPLLDGVLRASPYGTQLAALEGMVDGLRVQQGTLFLTLVWNAGAFRAGVDAARERLTGVRPGQMQVYRARLRALVAARDHPGFAAVLGRLFALARERSARGDPVLENRALLLTLAEAAGGVRLGTMVRTGDRMGGLRLAGRTDSVQHFCVSAGLAAAAGQGLADTAGLYKEMLDTRGGSGFSFTDLAADRAGTRLGRLATRSEADARRVQDRLAGTAEETLFMPRIADLPEYLGLHSFERRFGAVNSPRYKRLLAQIDARIDALALYADAQTRP
jgi:hypothetical protein